MPVLTYLEAIRQARPASRWRPIPNGAIHSGHSGVNEDASESLAGFPGGPGSYPDPLA
jgi:hypothetical protein